MSRAMAPESDRLVFLLAGGGYGGHIYPAIAVAEILKNDPRVAELHYVGREGGLEEKVAEKAGLPFYPLDCDELPRRVTPKLAPWSADLVRSVGRSLGYLRKIRPHLVFGTGGFISGPPIIAAKMMRIPFVLHDADAYPGLVNRVMAPFAEAVSIDRDEARAWLKNRHTVLNGNPIRTSFGLVPRETAAASLGLDPAKCTLLVMGGAMGSPYINRAVARAARTLIEEHGMQLVHQTGNDHFDATKQLLDAEWPAWKCATAYVLVPYLHDAASAMAAADLAVSRSGALSVAEFAALGLPSILVPFAAADGDHQTANALAYERAGAAVHVAESILTAEVLLPAVLGILQHPARLEAMRQASRGLFRPDAARDIARLLVDTALTKMK